MQGGRITALRDQNYLHIFDPGFQNLFFASDSFFFHLKDLVCYEIRLLTYSVLIHF